MISLHDKTALITGASRGIGRAAALLFARAGADVALTCHSRVADAEAVAREVRALGRRAWVGAGDLGDPAVVTRLFDEAAGTLGPLDCFIGNAGIWPVEETPVQAMSEARWTGTMRANLDAIFLSTRAALQRMRTPGRVVLVGSTAGQRGEAFHADYAATKGAMISFVKSLCVECAPGITVNCVAPGWVDTEMSWPAFGDGGRERIERTIPLRRIATAEDVAGPILFLCSDLGRHVTGEVLNVNGGSVLCG
ncbi:MAG TPA: SDR family NAD(P)-dependent oxidoreductase [Gemmatimonadales bacterium]|nr:SDR family NAD(P)-dependent oxidoreductase [Gemmatimonadales bacterium]